MARSTSVKVLATLLSVLTLTATAPFSLSETMAGSSPIGAVVTPGNVTVGSSVAPTGTTIFSGDQVSSTEPALINFNGGSRIEMTKAAATFNRDGKTLVVQATQGLLRFNFAKGENVQIKAGKYVFTAVNDTVHSGEIGMNRNGQLVMAPSEGVFAALDTATNARMEVSPSSPIVMLQQSGQGNIAKGGKTLTDSSKAFQANELKGKCVVANGEASSITGNTATVVTVKDSWNSNTGTYDYKVTDCTRDALVAAGATAGAAAGAAGAAAAGAAAAGAGAAAAGVSATVVAATVAGVAGAVGLGVGVYEATKSSSSR